MSLRQQLESLLSQAKFRNYHSVLNEILKIVEPIIADLEAENERLSLAFIKANDDAVEQIDALKKRIVELEPAPCSASTSEAESKDSPKK